MQHDGEPFAEKLARLTEQLSAQFAESGKLESTIQANLAALALHQNERINTPWRMRTSIAYRGEDADGRHQDVTGIARQ